MSENYFELITTDGEKRYIAPQFVEAIQQLIKSKSGEDHIGQENLRVKDIKYFRPSEKPYYDEATMLNSGEVVDLDSPFTEESEEGIKAIAVKKKVPLRKISEYKMYKILETDEKWATVGFWIASHHMHAGLTKCADYEIARLT